MATSICTPLLSLCKTLLPTSNQPCRRPARAQTLRPQTSFKQRTDRRVQTYHKEATRAISTSSDEAHAIGHPGDGVKKGTALIISGFTCIGKTFLCGNWKELKTNLPIGEVGEVVDLDSSEWPRDDFPANYLAHIRQTADQPGDRIILVSTSPGVAEQLHSEGYYVAQVYPRGEPECRDEWLRRLARREKGGRDSRLYRLVAENWDNWCRGELEGRNVAYTKTVSPEEYLSTVIGEIYEAFDAVRKRMDEGAIAHRFS